ncbi:hypothetical protein FOZ60_014251 [Perkinsus olseni]|uniref:Uncharacterized protein n=1 Tax=Perkinsus olseni TaxID=32597 RepID=A0A7J6N916_PEROL|nr:hypothetical protein FOZ60_014251 [Perkinsus olseni]
MANPPRVLLDGREVALYPASSGAPARFHCLALVAHQDYQGNAGIQESERRVLPLLPNIETASDDIIDILFGEAPAVCIRFSTALLPGHGSRCAAALSSLLRQGVQADITYEC